jgi:hypothetical protein
MQEESVASVILSFAGLLASDRIGETAERYAATRRWIDETGRPTRDGMSLFNALRDQRQTRSTLRLAI